LTGTCTSLDGHSHVRIFAGTITGRLGYGRSARLRARQVAHHEFDHAKYQSEVQQGYWLDDEPSDKKIEFRARLASEKTYF
jgi:hypothetical protein